LRLSPGHYLAELDEIIGRWERDELPDTFAGEMANHWRQKRARFLVEGIWVLPCTLRTGFSEEEARQGCDCWNHNHCPRYVPPPGRGGN
jgi:hypothetical protein